MFADLEDLLKATTTEAVTGALKTLVHKNGFEHFIFGSRNKAPSGAFSETILNGYPDKWLQRYQSENYISVDPIVGHSMQSTIPLTWDRSHFSATAATRKLISEASDFNIHEGTAFPMHANTLVEGFGVFCVTHAHRRREWLSDRSFFQCFCVMSATAPFVFEKVKTLANAPLFAATELTQRERDCLCWSAAGKTAWEIGRILQISEHTVQTHFKNCIRKLGVSGIRQAVAHAILHHIIRI